MAQPLDPLTVQRLAYVRYLYREGVEQSGQPSPLRSRAITSFHDAVENFIGLAAQHLGVELKKNAEFLSYWEAIKPVYELPKKDQMKRLNDARVALKHNGTFPSAHQIEQARETVVDFFTTVTPKIFGIELDTIDMVDLLTQHEVKELLRDAQTHADIGDYVQAMAGLSLAFQALLTNYQRGEGSTTWSAFNFGEKPSPFDEPRGEYRDPRLKRLEKLDNFMVITQDTLLAITLGIDYPSMARFHILTPKVRTYGNGDKRYYIDKALEEVTSDDYDWARHFVIESGLRAAKADDLQAMEKKRWEPNRKTKIPVPHRFWTGPVDPEDRSVTVFDVL
ncbi:hypothetical protein OHA79_49265 (plasmid) [Streptomyces sp. NBC_00841]|uniref:hypothetical protein n=1 Tax=unclassified Streptomyces TaxID=2593676 RepID=UPI00225ACA4C|nr:MULTISPECIES: hypothetical protein [unclassified Streptomyces]MCX4538693.1 hypothetical protein [Streptomyces sp. NBC_01669]WSA05494.1 hypothetical protein OHA79_49265 [Streptomyces sp. NBC_00841]